VQDFRQCDTPVLFIRFVLLVC